MITVDLSLIPSQIITRVSLSPYIFSLLGFLSRTSSLGHFSPPIFASFPPSKECAGTLSLSISRSDQVRGERAEGEVKRESGLLLLVSLSFCLVTCETALGMYWKDHPKVHVTLLLMGLSPVYGIYR